MNIVVFIVNKEHAYLRIDKFLVDKMIRSSRNFIQNAIRLGFVTVNNRNIKPNYKLKAKDIVTVKNFFFVKNQRFCQKIFHLLKFMMMKIL